MNTGEASNLESTRVAIVGGGGHVGLPLGLVLAEAGFEVTLVDVNEQRLRSIEAGQMPFMERGADALLERALKNRRLRTTTSLDDLAEHQVVIVTTGTPVDEYMDPDVGGVDRMTESLLAGMSDGQLLVIRSTVFPGVTDRLGRRIEELGRKIHLAYCPERIAQGYAIEELVRLPQLVAGVTPEASRRAAAVFGQLGARVIELMPVEAELAKLFTNAYRYINFAISNQFYMTAQRFGVDFERVRAAVREDYSRMAGFASAGLTCGPCLLKDTMQLASFNHNMFGLGQAAMMVNEGLPSFLVERLKAEHDLSRMTVGILGMAFKGNCDDPRSSLSYKLRKVLTVECRRVVCTDPYIRDPSFLGLEEVVATADVLILGACHDEYKALQPKQPIVDVFGFLEKGSRS
ncbi:MAG: nucleotide sugar dehydrogenase [Thermoguttaceae bacterium]